MKVNLYNRDFSELAVQPDVRFIVDRYSMSVFGGPKQATLQISGEPEKLFEMINHMRAPVEIVNDQGDVVWWGYVSNISINTSAGAFNVDLDTMSNNVAVAYTYQDVRYTTQWSDDADSVVEYGTKELLLSRADVTEADALQFRDVSLANTKNPIPAITFSGGKEGVGTVTCKGWISTLEWQYYSNLSGREGYDEIGRGGREIGEDDRPILVQSFQIAATAAWTASSVWLRVWKQGTSSPTDNLIVSLKADNAGEPGATLASGQIAGANIDISAEWMEFKMSAPVTLQPATTYWVHVTRSGAMDATAYFMVDTNVMSGYTRGKTYLYNTNLSTWVEEHGQWGDMLFIVVGSVSTTSQIGTLVTNCGQFLTGTIIEDASGLDSNPYRDGETAGIYELEQLLNAGTANHRRLLCEITQKRQMRVYEEPEKPEDKQESYALNPDGKILFAVETEIDQSLCPVGVWCRLQGIIPPTVDLSLISDPSLFFIDDAEYSVQDGKYSILATRDQVNVMDIGGVVQG
jgi:hypothetical protein